MLGVSAVEVCRLVVALRMRHFSAAAPYNSGMQVVVVDRPHSVGDNLGACWGSAVG